MYVTEPPNYPTIINLEQKVKVTDSGSGIESNGYDYHVPLVSVFLVCWADKNLPELHFVKEIIEYT